MPQRGGGGGVRGPLTDVHAANCVNMRRAMRKFKEIVQKLCL
jgi:hypothetical protein